jgi:hypothetical protein
MKTILEISAVNAGLFRRMLADVAPADMCRQPGGIVNHAAWQIGHVTFVRGAMARELGGDAGVPADWAGLFAPGTAPTADAARYPSKEELLAAFERAQRHVCELAAEAAADKLDQPTPIERLRATFPTVRTLVAGMLTLHDGLHLGQLSVWRRVQGLPRVI